MIDAADSQLLARSLGFAANLPPVLINGSVLTHVDLEVAFDLASLVTDPEDDPVFFRIIGSTNGMAQLSPDGQMVSFMPALGYSGQSGFQIISDDGYSASEVGRVDITVSSAPLVHMDFVAAILASMWAGRPSLPLSAISRIKLESHCPRRI